MDDDLFKEKVVLILFLGLWQKLKSGLRGERPSDSVLLLLLRGCFLAVVIGIATRAAIDYGGGSLAWVVLGGMILLGIAVVVVDSLLKDKQITTISAVYFGLLMGFLLSALFWSALQPVLGDYLEKEAKPLVAPVRGLLTLLLCYISISVLLQTKDEFRFIIPYVEFSKQVKGGKPLLLDTSVIIDGRIADICETRFLDNKLIVPRFVLQELQSIADSSDKLKRNRGRRGLDMLKRMQNSNKVELEIHEQMPPEVQAVDKVDERLVMLARNLGGRVVTNDFNLNKIAQLQGVEVINLNELANAMKSVALPGEMMQVKIVKVGDQPGQGVGYLEDGTMVVVEQGRSHMNDDILLTVTSVLQTPAGRMIFGKYEGKPEK